MVLWKQDYGYVTTNIDSSHKAREDHLLWPSGHPMARRSETEWLRGMVSVVTDVAKPKEPPDVGRQREDLTLISFHRACWVSVLSIH